MSTVFPETCAKCGATVETNRASFEVKLWWGLDRCQACAAPIVDQARKAQA